jgi:hypothetical protein
MSSAQRSDWERGYADGLVEGQRLKVAAVAAARAEWPNSLYLDAEYERGFKLGRATGRAEARDAVAVSPYCCNCPAPTTTSGEHDDWCMVFKILAAIDGVGEQA